MMWRAIVTSLTPVQVRIPGVTGDGTVPVQVMTGALLVVGARVWVTQIAGYTQWLLVNQPAAGPTGPTGLTGPTGAQGPTGPTGSIVMFGGASTPAGWLTCDGTAVSRTTYADLFTVVATLYGTGNGTTTFNLPNLRGRVPVGVNPADPTMDTIGETGGSATHTHDLSAGYAQVYQGSAGELSMNRPSVSSGWTETIAWTATKTNGTPTSRSFGAQLGGATGSGSSMQPFLALPFIVKT